VGRLPLPKNTPLLSALRVSDVVSFASVEEKSSLRPWSVAVVVDDVAVVM